MLWKFEFLVDGAKHVEEVMWLLQGRARDMKAPVPVVNARTVAGKTQGKHPNLVAALITECRKHEVVAPAVIRNFMINLGYSPNSYSAYLTKLLETGILGPKRADGTYKVIQPKAKALPKARRAKPRKVKPKTNKVARANARMPLNVNGTKPAEAE